MAALDRAAVESAIAARLRADPILQRVDGRRIDAQFEQYRQLASGGGSWSGTRSSTRGSTGRRSGFLAAAGTKLNGPGPT